MDLPTQWYVYIVPGLIVLASIAAVKDFSFFQGLKQEKNSYLLGHLVLIGFTAYLVGIGINAAGVYVMDLCRGKPANLGEPAAIGYALIYFQNRSDVIRGVEEGYNLVVLHRGLMVALGFSGLLMLWGIRPKEFRKLRVGLIAVCLFGAIVMYSRWKVHEGNLDVFLKEAVRLAKAEVTDNSSTLKLP